MRIYVMMASGETDEWEDAADAFDDRGSLVVLYEIEGDEIPGWMKTLEFVREIDQGEGIPPMTKGDTFMVAAQYAPGMWIKVEYAE